MYEEIGSIEFRFSGLSNTASLMAGSNGRRKKHASNKYVFCVTDIVGSVYNVTAQAGLAAAGTMLSRFSDPSPPATNPNAWPNVARVQTRFQCGRWFYGDDWTDWPNFVGTLDKPFKPSRLIVIPPNIESGIDLQTDISIAGGLAGNITMHGFYTDDPEIAKYAIRSM